MRDIWYLLINYDGKRTFCVTRAVASADTQRPRPKGDDQGESLNPSCRRRRRHIRSVGIQPGAVEAN